MIPSITVLPTSPQHLAQSLVTFCAVDAKKFLVDTHRKTISTSCEVFDAMKQKIIP